MRLAPTAARDKARILPIIDSLVASGSTAGAAALTLAYDQARRAFISGGINHILMCTDGDFNVGPSSTEALLALVKEQRQTGITLTVLGFGIGNLNDQMMERVSNAGNGIYGVISSATHADRYVDERLLSTLEHVAQNMKIQVEFNPARVVSYRLLGYEDRAMADKDFRNDLVDGGEVGAGHRVTALYELLLTGQVLAAFDGAPPVVDGEPTDVIPEVDPADLVLVKVRYQPAGAAQDSPALEVRAGLPAARSMRRSGRRRRRPALGDGGGGVRGDPQEEPLRGSRVRADDRNDRRAAGRARRRPARIRPAVRASEGAAARLAVTSSGGSRRRSRHDDAVEYLQQAIVRHERPAGVGIRVVVGRELRRRVDRDRKRDGVLHVHRRAEVAAEVDVGELRPVDEAATIEQPPVLRRLIIEDGLAICHCAAATIGVASRLVVSSRK